MNQTIQLLLVEVAIRVVYEESLIDLSLPTGEGRNSVRNGAAEAVLLVYKVKVNQCIASVVISRSHAYSVRCSTRHGMIDLRVTLVNNTRGQSSHVCPGLSGFPDTVSPDINYCDALISLVLKQSLSNTRHGQEHTGGLRS